MWQSVAGPSLFLTGLIVPAVAAVHVAGLVVLAGFVIPKSLCSRA
jgi:hypothetical protein